MNKTNIYMSRKFLTFKFARARVRKLGLKKVRDWSIYSSSGNRPPNIPGNPAKMYKGAFISYADWLGFKVGKPKNRFRNITDFFL